MLRRVHLAKLSVGSIALPVAEAHHIRDVLRLDVGSTIELFDDSGNVAEGIIKHVNSANVVVEVKAIRQASSVGVSVTVAAAVPKGDRADWMVEKLTELGVARFVPLAAERSVVLPAGRNKIERWERIAIESAKQSRRTGVMAIAALTPLEEVIASVQGRGGNQPDAGAEISRRAGSVAREPGSSEYLRTGVGVYLSTAGDAIPLQSAIERIGGGDVVLLIGPEGGWTEGEMDRMKAAGFAGASLTSTILRVETAAVIAAGMVLCERRSQ